MPIYEYRCSACGCEKEYLQKVSEPLKTECPECGKPALQKKVTAAGFQLKGSGWYATDFRDGGKKADAKKSSGDDKSKSSGGESKPADTANSSDGGESKKSESSGSVSASAPDSAGSSAKTSSAASTDG